MTSQNVRPDFAALLSRHGEIVAVVGSALRHEPEHVEKSATLRAEERQLRSRIIAWAPVNTAEAREKLKHLARFVAATGVGLDRATLDVIVHSTAFFFRN